MLPKKAKYKVKQGLTKSLVVINFQIYNSVRRKIIKYNELRHIRYFILTHLGLMIAHVDSKYFWINLYSNDVKSRIKKYNVHNFKSSFFYQHKTPGE